MTNLTWLLSTAEIETLYSRCLYIARFGSPSERLLLTTKHLEEILRQRKGDCVVRQCPPPGYVTIEIKVPNEQH